MKISDKSQYINVMFQGVVEIQMAWIINLRQRNTHPPDPPVPLKLRGTGSSKGELKTSYR